MLRSVVVGTTDKVEQTHMNIQMTKALNGDATPSTPLSPGPVMHGAGAGAPRAKAATATPVGGPAARVPPPAAPSPSRSASKSPALLPGGSAVSRNSSGGSATRTRADSRSPPMDMSTKAISESAAASALQSLGIRGSATAKVAAPAAQPRYDSASPELDLELPTSFLLDEAAILKKVLGKVGNDRDRNPGKRSPAVDFGDAGLDLPY